MYRLRALILLSLAFSFYGCEKMEYRDIQVGEITRSYGIFIPEALDPQEPSALLIDFHSTASSPEKQAMVSRFDSVAKREGFVIVRPKGIYKLNDLETWNADLDPEGPDDIEFVETIITSISSEFSIDQNRIYAAGFSGGARMVSRLACTLPAKISGFAMVAGLQYPDNCDSDMPVSIIAFHGQQDAVNHYELIDSSPVYWLKNVEDSLEQWAIHNGCAPIEITQIGEATSAMAYSDCLESKDVTLFSASDAGHTWPGNIVTTWLGLGETNRDINATKEIWQYFSQNN